MKKIAYIGYSRCSSEEQKKGYSHGYQRSGIQQSWRVADMEQLGFYEDTVTGTTVKRTALDEAIRFLERFQKTAHKYEKVYFLAYKADRFGRNVEGCLSVIRRLKDIDIEVNFTEEWIDYHDDNYPILLSMRFAIAQSESLRIGSRTKDGYRRMLELGIYPYAIPCGYTRIATGEMRKGKAVKRIEKNEKAKILRGCFDKYLTGRYSKAQLYREYGKDLKLSNNQFERIFHNEFYASFFTKGRTEYALTHEPICTKSELQEMQAISESYEVGTRGKNWKNPNNPDAEVNNYFLKGILKCHQTGQHMTAYEVKKKSGLRFSYYQPCNIKPCKTVAVSKAHTIVTELLKTFEMSDSDHQTLKSLVNKLASEKLSSIKKQLSDSIKAIELSQNRINSISMKFADSQFEGDFNNALKSKAEAEALIETGMGEVAKALRVAKNIGATYLNASNEKKAKILRSIFPQGFSIDELGNVVTSEVNAIILICRNNLFDNSKDVLTFALSKSDNKQMLSEKVITHDDFVNPSIIDSKSDSYTNKKVESDTEILFSTVRGDQRGLIITQNAQNSIDYYAKLLIEAA
jgi:DNA invertase Pin-like site-specific DNA recombinase